MATKKKATAKQPPLGRCCPVLALALQRDVSRDVRRGFEVATPFGLSDGKPRPEVLLYRFPKALRGDTSELKDATYAVCAYCPFCGEKLKRLDRESKKSLAKTSEKRAG